MIKPINLFLITLLSFSIISCGKSVNTSEEDTLDRIRKTGQIDVCVAVYPPSVIKDSKTGNLTGVSIDTMEAIAAKINAKVIWHETTFGNATAELQARHCDVFPFIFALIPRAEAVAFTSPPLAYTGLTAVVRKDDMRFRNIKDPFEFDKSDLTIALPTGTGPDYFVQENFHKAKIKRIDVEPSNLIRYLMEVSSGRADVGFSDTNEGASYAANHPEVIDLFEERPFSLNPDCWAVRQGDLKWLHFLETALQFLDTQGTLTQLEKKYHAHWIHQVKTYKLQ